MAKSKRFDWDTAELPEHSRRKHKILREYFYEYLMVRCRNPWVREFRIAVIDGFAGAGRYVNGYPGSPVIFIEELRHASIAANIERRERGLQPMKIVCILYLNDEDPKAIRILDTVVRPREADIRSSDVPLDLDVRISREKFRAFYSRVREDLSGGRYTNLFFNLDQYGYADVGQDVLHDMLSLRKSVEIFLTFLIEVLVNHLSQANPERLVRQLNAIDLDIGAIARLDELIPRDDFLGAAEKIVFETLCSIPAFASPFAIKNPDGYRYWLMHFANNYRARQVYNDTLHENSSLQAHYGHSGIDMLSFNPKDEHRPATLYLFDEPGRAGAVKQLLEDIPRFLRGVGGEMRVNDFYRATYNQTPAHGDDIHKALIEHPDIEVITQHGGRRRGPDTIHVKDVLKLKPQGSFSFPN